MAQCTVQHCSLAQRYCPAALMLSHRDPRTRVDGPHCIGGARLPYKYCDASLSVEERVVDLLSKFTYEEKCAGLAAGALGPIPRLGFVPLSGGESTHGVSQPRSVGLLLVHVACSGGVWSAQRQCECTDVPHAHRAVPCTQVC
jgi:hypothetical protein